VVQTQEECALRSGIGFLPMSTGEVKSPQRLGRLRTEILASLRIIWVKSSLTEQLRNRQSE
jgi:hypothetical protein